MKVGFRTDTGKKRANNEDAMLVLPKYGIFIVADGVGGQNYGEMASRKAVTAAQEFIEKNPPDSYNGEDKEYKANWLMNYFISCYDRVNEEILMLSQEDPDRDGMATTAVTAYIDEFELFVSNIGDSRAYVLRENMLSQITEDHTYVNNLINAGTLTENEALNHPQKNIITKALGTESGVNPDFYRTELMKDDTVLLCSDGLYGEVSNDQMVEIIRAGEDMNDTCRELVSAANANGGNDNITVICIRI